MDIEIVLATEADAGEILALQRLAYQEQARLYDDWRLPPLTQTLAGVRSDIDEMVCLKACVDGAIVGSVRARQVGETVSIGRLIVHPDRQRQGVGSRLLEEIEARFPDATRFELFTGTRSADTLRLYTRLGYRPFHEERQSPQVVLVFLEKRAARCQAW